NPFALEEGGFWRLVEHAFGGAITPPIREALLRAATAAERDLGLEARFDLTNPQAVQAVEREGGALIQEITDESRLAVRELVARSVQGEFDVRALAREVRNV